MQNVTIKRQGQKLFVEIDLSKEVGPSSSGKSIIVATTGGNAMIPDSNGAFIGVNVYRTLPKTTAPKA